MPEESEPIRSEDEIRDENQFIKMKLMLEHGAQFEQVVKEGTLPPEVENAFLKHIAAFENYWADPVKITVFEKIGRPAGFPPVDELAPGEIAVRWKQLLQHLRRHGVDLVVFAPGIPEKELYRFTTEELFGMKTDDIPIRGVTVCFVYDEFHPDEAFENGRLVTCGLLPELFSKAPFNCESLFRGNNFFVNGQFYESFELFQRKIDNFKRVFDVITLLECSVESSVINERTAIVKGNYAVEASGNVTVLNIKGSFIVRLQTNSENYWQIISIDLDGFRP